MAAKKKDDPVRECPRCGGEGFVPAGRYTDPPMVCPSCDGTRFVAVQDVDKILAELVKESDG